MGPAVFYWSAGFEAHHWHVEDDDNDDDDKNECEYYLWQVTSSSFMSEHFVLIKMEPSAFQSECCL